MTLVDDAPLMCPIPEPDRLAAKLRLQATALGSTLGALKAALKPIGRDLPAERARLELFRKQQPPLWESRLLMKECQKMVGAVTAFLTTLETTRTLLDESKPLFDPADQYVQIRREQAAMAFDIEQLEAYMPKLLDAKRAYGECYTLLRHAADWEALSRVSVIRHFRAVDQLTAEYERLRITAALESFRTQTARLRTAPSPFWTELTAYHSTVEALGGQPLPLTRLVWPENNPDPFAAPELA